MKHVCLLSLLLSISLLSGCRDRINIEDISLSLLVGIDLDKENQLLISSSSPVFNTEAKEKEENTVVKTTTLRHSRQQFDATINALTSRGKLQVLLIGKRVLQHKDWFPILDSFYRDSKDTVMTRVVLVDGPVSDILLFKHKDKPRLPLYLTKLLDTAHQRNITVITSLQELHRQFSDRGLSPSITELKKDGEIKVTGTALLDRSGKYKLSLNADETQLLRIMQNQTDGQFTFTIHLPQQSDDGIFHENMMSFVPEAISVKTKTNYKDNKFIFDIGVKMRIAMKERLFPFDVKRKAPELEKQIQEELQKQFSQLLKKIQNANIDPIGLGLYARAYEYSEWKEVQDKWGEALSKAEVRVNVLAKIQAMGAMK
ncbi:Ger(x)C family spore germination protein [Paenibacillus sp. FSL H7-0331]|uniref:Ger(x)C family spore germination protein n=1 Tax=Paenibacillus sp. FSL H7-0331 TaxID=1920421 RepID=UPI00096F49FE|nr:Ger(x)C family spore germination protein [Paenibacillus sp. FSL H7-0331]OMF18719.1 spore gernimation protein [Paenibacillus sp. FSL H7-0331]